MADMTKLIDLDLLKVYDEELKKWIGDQADVSSLHTIKKDSSARKYYFYTEKAADVTDTTTPAFTIDLTDIDTTIGTMTDLETTEKTNLVAAINELFDAIDDIDYSGKADKVESATEDNFAALDADGNLKDSGKKAADFDEAGAAAAVSGYAEGETAKTVKEVAEGLGTVASEDLNTTALADADSEAATLNEDIPTAAQVVKYVKDKTAAVTGALHWRGIKSSTSEVTDPAEGDVVIVDTTEYIYDGSKWQELGNEGAWVAKTTTIAGVDLQDDITAEELLTALDVEEGAQENVIEKIKVGDAEQAIADKTVTLGTMAGESADDYVAVDSVSFATEEEIKKLFEVTP